MKKSSQNRVAAAFLGASLMFASAGAQSIDAVTGEQLESALDAAGLGPSMTEDVASGAPVATGTAGPFEFNVRAMDCAGDPLACENLVFFANFPLGRTVTADDFRIVNRFNDSQVFGRAYILESRQTVGVDYVIDLGGGVSEDHLAQNISRWADVIAAFVASFQEGAASS